MGAEAFAKYKEDKHNAEVAAKKAKAEAEAKAKEAEAQA